MPVIEGIRNRNKFFIPTVISRLVTADQQNRATARVKSKEHPIWPSRMLHPKFFHVRMTRRVNEIGMRTRKPWADFLEENPFGVHIHLFGLGQAVPPVRELVCKFDLPFHRRNIAPKLCFVNPRIDLADMDAQKTRYNSGRGIVTRCCARVARLRQPKGVAQHINRASEARFGPSGLELRILVGPFSVESPILPSTWAVYHCSRGVIA